MSAVCLLIQSMLFLSAASKAKTEEKKKKKKPVIVPLKALENSISECEQFLRSKNHDDIDDRDSVSDTALVHLHKSLYVLSC